MRFLDVNKLGIRESEQVLELEKEIKVKNLMELNVSDFSKAIKMEFQKVFDKEELKDRTLIKIKTDLSEQDFDLMRDVIINHFVKDVLLTGEKREREKRLARPKDLENVDILYATMMDLINWKTQIDIFNIIASSRTGNYKYPVVSYDRTL